MTTIFSSLLTLGLFSLLWLSSPVEGAALNVCGAITIASEESVNNPNYTGVFELEGRQILQGWQMWAELVNAKGGILVSSVAYTINLTVINHGDGSDPLRVRAVYRGLLNGSYGVHCNFMFGPWTSGLTAVAAQENELASPPRTLFGMHASAPDTWECTEMLQPPCTQVGFRRFQYSWGGAPTSSSFFVPAVELLFIKGPRTIATFDFPSSYSSSLISGAVLAAESNGIEVIYQSHAPTLLPNISYYDDLVLTFKELDPDIVAGGTYFVNCIEFIKACERHHYVPKAVITSLCLSNPTYANQSGPNGRYIMDFSTWDAEVDGPEFLESNSTPGGTFFRYFSVERDASGRITKASPRVFADRYFERWGEYPVDPLGNGAIIDGYLLEWAITKSQSIETEAIQNVLPLISENSFYGKLVFDVYGTNDKKTTLVTQTDLNNVNRIVYPNSAIQMSVIYPIPTLDERVMEAGFYTHSSEIAITVVTCVNIVHCLLWMVFVFHYRQHVVFRAAQAEFLYLFLFGGVLILLGIFTWQIYVTSSSCQAAPWLFAVGFTLLVGTVFIRAFRIFLIVRASNKMKRV
ncbi:MAG: ABC transporter substrate-binding protein, partial [archaeon]|nr:ABC transporter substrate-binding protein [archaeon]